MTSPGPSGGLAALLASLVIGAILAGVGLTLAVYEPRSALLDGASGAGDASVTPTVDALPAAAAPEPSIPEAAAPESPSPKAAARQPLPPAAASPGGTDGAPVTKPGVAPRSPILPKAAPAGAGRPGSGPADAQVSARSSRQVPGDTIAAAVAATNVERVAAGCRALRVDDRLNAAAQRHSVDMANRKNMSHRGRNGSKFTDRIRAAGYPRPGAENIAFGQPTAASVVADWMASSGHRRNIVNCAYTAIGVGFDSRGNYWTQNFGF
ncbi:MAG: CAP domain-containing protein [Pseudonocardiaceae bacterium]